MAIALDTFADLGVLGASPSTTAYTCTGANGVLLVPLYFFGGAAITSVTYNGVALSQLTTVDDGGGVTVRIYGLVGPATGAHNIVVTYSGGGTVRAAAISYTGVLQSSLPDSSATKQQAGGPTSIVNSTTVVASNAWVVVVGESDTGSTPTASTNVTSRQASSAMLVGDSNGVVSAGSYSQTFGVSAGGTSTISQVSLAPALSISTGSMFLVF